MRSPDLKVEAHASVTLEFVFDHLPHLRVHGGATRNARP
jgi:hypothetical protein